MTRYSVWDEGQKKTGEARELLEEVRQEAAVNNEEIRAMKVDEYARSLIKDAPYLLPDSLYEALKNEPYETDYDRALAYLSAMPASRIRILSRA